MRLFSCHVCAAVTYFENRCCAFCGSRLAYLPDHDDVSVITECEDGWQPRAHPELGGRLCANAVHDACNWFVPAGSNGSYCLACRHNGTIPDITRPDRLEAWRSVEAAKHRLVAALLRLGLPLATRAEDPRHGLEFNVLADPADPRAPRVMTAHHEGRITIALSEADAAERELRRVQLGETYRTLLGHFRHESAHHYWNVLVRDAGRLEACRRVFANETNDYGSALQRH